MDGSREKMDIGSEHVASLGSLLGDIEEGGEEMGDKMEKGPGQGRGPQTKKGKLKLQAAKVANIEDFLSAQFPGQFTPVEAEGNEDEGEDEETPTEG